MGRGGDSGLGGGIFPVGRALVTAARGAGRAAQHLLQPEAWPHPRAINSWHCSLGQTSPGITRVPAEWGTLRAGGWGLLFPKAALQRGPSLSPSWE